MIDAAGDSTSTIDVIIRKTATRPVVDASPSISEATGRLAITTSAIP